MRSIIAMLILFIYATTAYATPSPSKFSLTMVSTDTAKLTGEFGKGITSKLQLLYSFTGFKKLIVNSPGGLVIEGFKMAKFMNTVDVSVEVPRGAYCLSACAVAFMGNNLTIEGLYGFHTPYYSTFNMDTTINNYTRQIRHVDAMFLEIVITSGYRMALYDIVADNTDRSTFIIFTSNEDLAKFKHNNSYNDLTEVPTDYLKLFRIMKSKDISKYNQMQVYQIKQEAKKALAKKETKKGDYISN